MYQLKLARSVPCERMTPEFVKDLRDNGIRFVEFGTCGVKIDFDPATVKATFEEKAALLRENGIEVLSVHLPFGPTWEMCVLNDEIRERAMDRYLELIEICRFMQPKRYVLHPGYPRVPKAERPQRIANFRKNVVKLVAAAAPAKIAVENMPQDCLGNTAEELVSLVEGIEGTCLCCDMNHWYQSTTYESIPIMASRLETVHINDFDGYKERHWLPGDGCLDWNRIIDLLRENGYTGPFLYECNHGLPAKATADNYKMLFENYNNWKRPTVNRPDMAKMTLREKIAQTLIVRQSDLFMHADTGYSTLRDPEEAFRFMRENQYGGIWSHGNMDVNQMCTDLNSHFQFTSESYVEWVKKLEAEAKIPLICANDLNGPTAIKDISAPMSGLSVGAADDVTLSYRLGRLQARERKCYGSDWTWAPMVDLVNPFTGGIVRPFSGLQENLIEHASAYIRGMQSENMAACAKHFPGTDPKENRDSHVVTTYMRMDYETWKENQGAVFQALIDAGVYTVMTGAKAWPAVDDTKVDGRYVPASLSHKIVTGLLKEKMGFAGGAITDDVTMGGYTSFYPREKLYVELIKAGHDALLGVAVDAVDILEAAVLRGELSEERIDDACRRMLDLKEKLGLFDSDHVRGRNKVADIRPLTEAVSKDIARKSLTLLRDKMQLLPVSQEKVKKVCVIVYTMTEGIMNKLNPLKEAFEARGAEVTLRRSLTSWKELQEIADSYDLILYLGYLGFHNPKGGPSFYGDEFWSLRYAFTSGLEKTVAASIGYPYIHYFFMDDAPAFINCYKETPQIQEALVEAIYGEIPFRGISPVELNMD